MRVRGDVVSKIRIKEIALVIVSPLLGFTAYFISDILANIVPGNIYRFIIFAVFDYQWRRDAFACSISWGAS